MNYRDAAALVARDLRRRLGRSLLTASAVALAATLLTALVTIAGSAQNRVLSEVTQGGPLAGIKVAAAAPDPSQVDRDDARPGPPRPLDDGAVSRIRALRGVDSVVPILAVPVVAVTPRAVGPAAKALATTTTTSTSTTSTSTTTTGLRPRSLEASTTISTRPGAAAASTASTVTTITPASAAPAVPPLTLAGRGPDGLFGETLVGVNLAQASRLPITVLAGRLPVPGSMAEVAVTQGYLERLHLHDADAPVVVGTEVEVGAPRLVDGQRGGRRRALWRRETVVGVVAQEAGPGQFLGSIEQARSAQDWIARSVDGGVSVGLAPTQYTGLLVVAHQLSQVTTVRARITAVGYATTAPESLIASVQRYLNVVTIVLTAVGLIALVVAALGITNALLAAVRERRREIGVLKAIGARDRDVRRLFMLEAAVLGLAGGLVGSLAGVAVARAVGEVVNGYLRSQALSGVRLDVPLLVPVAGVLGSTLLAMLAGVVPAGRAAALPAYEAVTGG